jgi:hypothetical protein
VVDECIVTPGLCHHTCTDTCESYKCSCDSGYVLQDDQRTCQGTVMNLPFLHSTEK